MTHELAPLKPIRDGAAYSEDVQSALDSVSANYCLFLAVDAASINDEALRKTGKPLLERGVAYFCVWDLIVKGCTISLGDKGTRSETIPILQWLSPVGLVITDAAA